MAKVTPPQNIPSELLDGYRAALGEKRPDDGVRKRYPYRVPAMQSEVGHPSPSQKTQRARFNLAVEKFDDTDWPTRQRWYDAMPPWGSLLWYYDYFILSALMGDAYLNSGGLGVIKSIQVVKEEVPTTGTKAFAISTVDPAKTVVMLYGNSFISDRIQRHTGTMADNTETTINLSPTINLAIAETKVRGGGGYQEVSEGSGSGMWADITLSYLSTTQAKIKLVNIESPGTFSYSLEVIEHLAQTVFPVIVSIAATVITIDWAKVPSVAADVSIIVIEYI